ncbi:transglutaminase superfamily protein [Mobilisporobacter senegalensis]|uniref:Transglutaminase superfamily protein n=1 Tax=Mobilisporobacter senegalensis TaxID=1329262 RepID=A0A3N1XPT3_9FIRM|nr:transglutaminase domain-containing protein [Mobilisporobacter senegalensis]ROR27112.1 transglutaminase superfamily protein [Mobilisporobacter senegalensis]
MDKLRFRKTKLGHRFIHCVAIFSLIMVTVPTDSIAAQLENYRKASVASENAITIDNEKEQIKEIRKAMLYRKPSLELYYPGSINDLEMDLEKLLNKVFAINEKSTTTDGDYLANIYSGYKVESYYNSLGASLTYHFTYHETKKQTDMVNKKIKSILKDMNISKKSTYQKVKLIHDYIVNHTSYDTTYTKYNAYNALIDKSSVCQGYSLLAYKMLTEAGVPARIITGFGDGEAHAWNIVKIGDVWYNLDCTWDDPITSNGKPILQYDYFLKNEKDFKNHVRDTKFTTKSFNSKYPMAKNSYSMKKK